MTRLDVQDVVPIGAHVALVDATWQDYPFPDPIDTWVTVRADSLTDPDHPPYPGLSVKTREAGGPDGTQTVRIETCDGSSLPAGLACVFRTLLHVGDHGVLVGNEDSGMVSVPIPRGTFPLSVWVDADQPQLVARVVFAVEFSD